jgi:drug/metabolite transporter (DMT)-like permease
MSRNETDKPMSADATKGLSLPVRRVIACIGIVVFLTVYVVIVSSIGQKLPNNQIVHLLYYGLSGILWGIPVLPIISWSENYKRKTR